jgi:hypothetical protein
VWNMNAVKTQRYPRLLKRNIEQARIVIDALASGHSLSHALPLAGINVHLWYQWVEMSYEGYAPSWIYDETAKANGKECDLCGDHRLKMHLVSWTETYDAATITMRFCIEGCADKWRAEDTP